MARKSLILGIDPGTKCGWALLDYKGKRVESGVWKLQTGEHRGTRYTALHGHIYDLLGNYAIDTVVIEEVRRHLGTTAAHVYGGIVAVISMIANDQNIPVRMVPVGTAKKQATGKGNASKEQMVEAATKQWKFTPSRDDEADACWLAETYRVRRQGG